MMKLKTNSNIQARVVLKLRPDMDHTWSVPSVSIGRPVLSGAHYFKRSQFERRLENAIRCEHLIDVAE